MQSNSINIPVGGTVLLPCAGSMVAFESGSSTTANLYIIIRGTQGSEMRLKPGQSFNTGDQMKDWYIKADDPAAAISAKVIIGDGNFHDSAINATIAGAVTVTSGHIITDAGSVTSATIANANAQAV